MEYSTYCVIRPPLKNNRIMGRRKVNSLGSWRKTAVKPMRAVSSCGVRAGSFKSQSMYELTCLRKFDNRLRESLLGPVISAQILGSPKMISKGSDRSTTTTMGVGAVIGVFEFEYDLRILFTTSLSVVISLSASMRELVRERECGDHQKDHE